MESYTSFGGLANPCRAFYERMANCIRDEDLHTRMCYTEMEDFYECKSKKKHRAFEHYMADNMQKV